MCSLLNYTFSVLLNELRNDIPLKIGPKEMSGCGTINEMIPGLESNRQYTTQVEVSYSAFAIIQNTVVSDNLRIGESIKYRHYLACYFIVVNF